MLLVAGSGWAQEGYGYVVDSIDASFPFLSPVEVQRNILFNAFSFQMLLFGGINGTATVSGAGSAPEPVRALMYLAMTAMLVGSLMIIFNPKYRKISTVAPWLLLVIITIFAPYGSKLLFTPLAKEVRYGFSSSAPVKDCLTNPLSCGFTPQLVGIHVASILQLTFSDLFNSRQWKGLIDQNNAKLDLYNEPKLVASPEWLPRMKRFGVLCGGYDLNTIMAYRNNGHKPPTGVSDRFIPQTLADQWAQFKAPYMSTDISKYQMYPPRAVRLYDEKDYPAPLIGPPEEGKSVWASSRAAYERGLTKLFQTVTKSDQEVTLSIPPQDGKILASEALEKMKEYSFFQSYYSFLTHPQCTVTNRCGMMPGFFFIWKGAPEGQLEAAQYRACYNGSFDQGFGSWINGGFTATNLKQSCSTAMPQDQAESFRKFINNEKLSILGDTGTFGTYSVASGTPWEGLDEVLSDPIFQEMPVGVITYKIVDPTKFDWATGAPVANDEPMMSCLAEGNRLIDEAVSWSFGRTGKAYQMDKFKDLLEKPTLAKPQGALRTLSTDSVNQITDSPACRGLGCPTSDLPLAKKIIDAFDKHEESVEQRKGAALSEEERANELNGFILDTIKTATATLSSIKTPEGQKATEDSTMVSMVGNETLTSYGGWGAIFFGRILTGIGAWLTGPLSAAIVYFLSILVDMALLILIVLTPIMFLIALAMPSAAIGVLTISIMGAFILKVVPITLLILNNIGGMIYTMIGAGGGPNSGVMQDMMILAMGGLYANIVGMTFFLLFKLGDPATVLSRFTALDGSAKQIADKGWDVTKTLAVLAASPALLAAGGAIGGALGAAGADKLTAAAKKKARDNLLKSAGQFGIDSDVAQSGAAALQGVTEEQKATAFGPDGKPLEDPDNKLGDEQTQAMLGKAAEDSRFQGLGNKKQGYLNQLGITGKTTLPDGTVITASDFEVAGTDDQQLASDNAPNYSAGMIGQTRTRDDASRAAIEKARSGDIEPNAARQTVSEQPADTLAGEAAGKDSLTQERDVPKGAVEELDAPEIPAGPGPGQDGRAATLNQSRNGETSVPNTAESGPGIAENNPSQGAGSSLPNANERTAGNDGTVQNVRLVAADVPLTAQIDDSITPDSDAGQPPLNAAQEAASKRQNEELGEGIHQAGKEIDRVLESPEIKDNPALLEAARKAKEDLAKVGSFSELEALKNDFNKTLADNNTSQSRIDKNYALRTNLDQQIAAAREQHQNVFKKEYEAIDAKLEEDPSGATLSQSEEAIQKRRMELRNFKSVGVVEGQLASDLSNLKELQKDLDIVGKADQRVSRLQAAMSGAYGGFAGSGSGFAKIPVIGSAISEALNEFYQAPERAKAWNTSGGFKKWFGNQGTAQRMGFFQKEMAPLGAAEQYTAMQLGGGFEGMASLARQAANEAAAKTQSQFNAMMASQRSRISHEFVTQNSDRGWTPNEMNAKLDEFLKYKMNDVNFKANMSIEDLKGLGAFEAADRISSVRQEAFIMQGTNLKIEKADLDSNMLLKTDANGNILSLKVEKQDIALTADVLDKYRGDLANKSFSGKIDDMMITHYGLTEKQYLRGNADWNATRYMTSSNKAAQLFAKQDVSTDYLIGGHIKMVEGKEKFKESQGKYETLYRMRLDEVQQKDREIHALTGGKPENIKVILKDSGYDFKLETERSPDDIATMRREALDKIAKKELEKRNERMPLEAVFEESYTKGLQYYVSKSFNAPFNITAQNAKIYDDVFKNAASNIDGLNGINQKAQKDMQLQMGGARDKLQKATRQWAETLFGALGGKFDQLGDMSQIVFAVNKVLEGHNGDNFIVESRSDQEKGIAYGYYGFSAERRNAILEAVRGINTIEAKAAAEALDKTMKINSKGEYVFASMLIENGNVSLNQDFDINTLENTKPRKKK